MWLILGDIGSPVIMREQLDKLAGLASEPGVVIQILPFTARAAALPRRESARLIQQIRSELADA